MTTAAHHHHHPIVTPAPPQEPAALNWVAMLIPFVLITIALAVAGPFSWPQAALTLPFLAIPLAIVLLRRQARRSATRYPR